MLSPLNCIPDFIIEYWNTSLKADEEIYTAYIDDIIYISAIVADSYQNLAPNAATNITTIFLGKVIYGDLYIYHRHTWIKLEIFERLLKLKAFW